MEHGQLLLDSIIVLFSVIYFRLLSHAVETFVIKTHQLS